MDNVDRFTRSRTMAAVNSKNNRSTEWRLRPFLVRAGLRGWKVQAIYLPGKPDFVFIKSRIAIFVDGCFWHGCPKCCRMPKSNKTYWRNKIKTNMIRDKNINKILHNMDWKVIRFWEHEIHNKPFFCINKIESKLKITN